MTHHCKRHRPAAPRARHRRLTAGYHARRLTAIVAFAAAAIGLLYAAPGPASAAQSGASNTYAASMSDGTEAATDYGSGFPGGPIGAQVLSLKDYTSRSDWMTFGDSITKGGYKAMAAAAPDKRLAVDAWSGRNTAATVDSLENLLAQGYEIPDRVVWATGSNDVFNPFVMPAQLARMFAAMPANVERIYMLDVQVNRPGYAGDQRNTMLVNKAIWEACAKEPRCTLISWSSFLAAKPAYRLPAYIDGGGVHPTVPTGYDARAALIAGAVTW